LSEKLLIVDDEDAIRKFLRIALTGEGYQVLEASTGRQALESVQQNQPDAVLLDQGLPDLSGLEVTRQVREWSWVPILFVSVNEEERLKIEAFDAGADDYLCKPFSVDELMARLRAALRRKHILPQGGRLRCGLLSLDQDAREVTVGQERIGLTKNEFAVLQVLMRRQGKLVSHRQLLQEVWGPGYEQDTHMLRVNISNLRKKLEVQDSPRYLVNEQGIGYRVTDQG